MPERLCRLSAPALLTGVGLALTWATWGTWPDVLVDAGREAYVAWQLAAGRRLYADVAHLNGPLSPYWNALCFRVGGVALRTLFAVDLAVLAAIVALLHRLLVRAGGRLGATVACVVLLTVFAFGQKVGIGNYNYVFPYSHEMTHGLLLALVALELVARYTRRPRAATLGAAGAALGLAFLTKPEVFVAAAVASAVALALATSRPCPRARAAALSAGAVGLVLPPLVAWALLARGMAAADALRGVLGAWPWIVRGDVATMPFYRTMLGVDAPAANLRAMLGSSALVAGFVALGAGAALAVRRRAPLAAPAAFAAVVLALAARADAIPWTDLPRALPVVMLVAGAIEVCRVLRSGAGAPGATERLPLLVLGAALLGKMLLHARLERYGFVLAMPATCVAVAAAVDWLPAGVARRGGSAGVMRAVALAAVFVFVAVEQDADRFWLARKTEPVGSGGDAFRADVRGREVDRAVEALRTRLRPDDTVVALPEGAMLNYLARRENPTPYANFMPPEVALFGERAIVDALARHPPDWVALVHKDTSEYGVARFGRDYGARVYKWMKRHYRPDVAIGARPLRAAGFGIELWRRAAPRA